MARVIIFLDESGDHSLGTVDPGFPVFVLTLLAVKPEHYYAQIVPSVHRLKFRRWGHEGVILHSRDIRKAQGDFNFLKDQSRRKPFYEEVNAVMRDSDYTLISVGIRKDRHVAKYGRQASNPYLLAMEYALERLVYLLQRMGETDANLIAEARGKKEDTDLELALLGIINNGSRYVDRATFKQFNLVLKFVSKQRNVTGTQLADLVAYPTARWMLDPRGEHPAFGIIHPKILRKPTGYLLGLKIFP